MDILITRVDGAVRVTPAPPYLTDYLQYSHRSFETVNFQKVNKFEKKLLHSMHPESGIITFQGFFEKICKLIHTNGDVCQVQDLRTPLPPVNLQAVKDINWAALGSTGLRDYQYAPVIEFLTKGRVNSGVLNACGGYGKQQLTIS